MCSFKVTTHATSKTVALVTNGLQSVNRHFQCNSTRSLISALAKLVIFLYFSLSGRPCTLSLINVKFKITTAATVHIGLCNVRPTPSWQISCRSVKPLSAKIWRFKVSQNSSRPPYWNCCNVLKPPTKSTCCSISLCTIWLESMQ